MPVDESTTWDGLARRYDTIVRLFDRSYPEIRRRLAEHLRGRTRVLELAAGTGQFTAQIAEVATEVIATDVSPKMIERLAASVRDAGLHNVEVRVMSAYAIDEPTDSVDAVVCANALHVMERPHEALVEMRRVLGPSGVLIAPTFLHGADWTRRTLSSGLSLVSPFVAHTKLDLDALGHLVQSVGFTIEHREQLSGLIPVGYVIGRAPD